MRYYVFLDLYYSLGYMAREEVTATPIGRRIVLRLIVVVAAGLQ